MRRTNLVPDVINCDLPLDNRRSPGLAAGRAVHDRQQVLPVARASTRPANIPRRHAHTSAAVLICIKGKGYTYTWPERAGETPWKDGKGDQVQAGGLRAVRHGHARPRAASAGITSISIRRHEPFRLTAWFGPNHPTHRHRPAAGRQADRLYRDGCDRGRHLDPVLDGGPAYPRPSSRRMIGETGGKSRMDPALYDRPKGAVTHGGPP